VLKLYVHKKTLCDTTIKFTISSKFYSKTNYFNWWSNLHFNW